MVRGADSRLKEKEKEMYLMQSIVQGLAGSQSNVVLFDCRSNVTGCRMQNAWQKASAALKRVR